ncbi:MAG: alkaline shock response membrane anchor protein AmaP [Candidatus Omnitrophica bacterium]|nr:alkaline shock response membrane anchor protein AmaP [Candidatus Omnitrophota bacterium]MBU4148920.1 alkaline shock response membrane anchor protein AmaP [Candidatus Omnitrophota bacterium]
MKIFSVIAIFIYTLLFSIIGATLIALSLRTESLDVIVNTVNSLSHTDNVRLGMALTGLLLIFINISIARISLGKMRRLKTIAFDNPYGRVTVSLAAIEDYIKKLTNKMPEIKELRSSISANKKGVEVAARAILYSGGNIPEITEKIQNAIRIKLQEMLGLEETVTIKIDVAKIVHGESKFPVKAPEDTGFKGEIEYGK